MPKLGKLAPQFHTKTLAFEKYLTVELPVPVSKVFREYAIPAEVKQMFGNDHYGDCVWAMWANFIILTSSHTGNLVIPTLDDVLKAYSDVTGFDPQTGMNDNGTSMTDSMEYMRTTGMAGVKILGWAKIDHTNRDHRNLGVQLFGATLVGVQFPESAQVQFAKGQSWEYVPDSPIEGGHAILHPGYGRAGDNYVTWAKWDQKAGLPWAANVDEEYVAITEMWLDKATKKTPGGLDLATLQSDIEALSA
jgi:hypothetical protein